MVPVQEILADPAWGGLAALGERLERLANTMSQFKRSDNPLDFFLRCRLKNA